jgi:hypothetical protein
MAITAAEAPAWHAYGVDLKPLGQCTAMKRFIRRENIKRYRKLLLEATDEAERRLIQKLLTEEEHKESAAETSSPPTASSPQASSWHMPALTLSVGEKADKVRRWFSKRQ